MSGKQADNTGGNILLLKLNSEKILDSLSRMQKDINDIKKSLFEPDSGLYTRVGRNTQFRTSASRWLWILTSGLIITLLKAVFNLFSK